MAAKQNWVNGDVVDAAALNALGVEINSKTNGTDVVSDSDFRLDDNRTPIDGSVTTAKLDATLQAAVSGLTGLGSAQFVTEDSPSPWVLNADNATNVTLKSNAYGVKHYTNAEEPLLGMTLSADTSANTVRIGGGVAAGNAATLIQFYTGATSTTTTGTLWTSIDTVGFFDHRARMRVRGDASGSSALDVGTDTAAAQFMRFNTAAGNARDIQFASAGTRRWAIRAEATAESGSDAGSNLQIISYTDAGTAKTTIVDVNRATGAVTLAGLLSTLASATGTAGLRLPHGSAPTSPVNGDVWTTTAGVFARINGSTVQFSNTRPRSVSVSNTTSWTIDSDAVDYAENTGLTGAVTLNNPTGTPVNGQKLWVSLTGTASRAISYGTAFESSTVTLPITTSGTARLDFGLVWNTATSKWRCIGVA